jgi:hypothetical protein
MSVEIALITPPDIPHAITTIQSAFVHDPFNFFIYDRSKLSLVRNAASLGIRLRWGIANGHVLVAHTPVRRCAGVAMWVPPKPLREGRTWWEWSQSWWLWMQQVVMNLRYGRGGLRVDVASHSKIGRVTDVGVEILAMEEATGGNAETSLDGRKGILVPEYPGHTSRQSRKRDWRSTRATYFADCTTIEGKC